MRWERIKPAEGRRMPWKNGGGTTLELAVEPSGATLETGFQWRVSSAEIGESGPFSSFPGMERWLLLLQGEGIELDCGPHGHLELREPLQPVHFWGDWSTWATLIGGPCTDFNVMVDPRHYRVSVDTGRLTGGQRLLLDAPVVLLFIAAGTLSLPALDLHLGQGHFLRIEEGDGALALAPGLVGASLITVKIWPQGVIA